MGIPKSAFKLLLEEAKRTNFKGKRILQLGRQHTFLTLAEAIDLTKKAGFQYSDPVAVQFSFKNTFKYYDYINDLTLFSLLGFSEVHSLDVSSYEQSSILHDLNEPVPIALHQQYDVIFDGGTLEHIFNVPQVFKNIHNLLKEDGIIIHGSPSHNYVDHGFYMFSPTLFSEYYSTNLYKTLTSYIFEYGFEYNAPWNVFEYQPGCLDVLSFGGFGKKMLGIWFIAQKQPNSTGGIVPQQGAYKGQWSDKEAVAIAPRSSFKEWLKKSRLLRFTVIRLRKKIDQFKTKHFRLKKIGVF